MYECYEEESTIDEEEKHEEEETFFEEKPPVFEEELLHAGEHKHDVDEFFIETDSDELADQLIEAVVETANYKHSVYNFLIVMYLCYFKIYTKTNFLFCFLISKNQKALGNFSYQGVTNENIILK